MGNNFSFDVGHIFFLHPSYKGMHEGWFSSAIYPNFPTCRGGGGGGEEDDDVEESDDLTVD